MTIVVERPVREYFTFRNLSSNCVSSARLLPGKKTLKGNAGLNISYHSRSTKGAEHLIIPDNLNLKNIMKAFISFIFLFGWGTAILAQAAKILKLKHKFIVIAHRGDHTDVPENTIAAFKNGIKNGVDYVEIDLRTTKDSVLVIMHDATVDRMTSGKGKVSELLYSEIQKNFLANTSMELLDGDFKDYDSALLQVATSNGKTVWPDIQGPDESRNWESAVQIGFKGLQTDHPEALIDYLKKRGLR